MRVLRQNIRQGKKRCIKRSFEQLIYRSSFSQRHIKKNQKNINKRKMDETYFRSKPNHKKINIRLQNWFEALA